MNITNIFEKGKYGFWKQVDPKPFEYDLDYKKKQNTNVEMSYLRLGWLMAFFDYERLKSMQIVDVGSGNGSFVKNAGNVVKIAKGYDLCGESISRDELYETVWDIVFLTDVLEHFENIDHLFKMKWKYCFLSFPETPDVKDYEELTKWKHFKPNEHIWCLNSRGICNWLEDKNCIVIATSCIEDAIRIRWNKTKINISTVLAFRSP